MRPANRNGEKGAGLAARPVSLDRIDTTDAERSVPCPRCGAGARAACSTPEGVRRREAHFERVIAAMVEMLRPIAEPGPHYRGLVSTVERAYAIGRATIAGMGDRI